MFLIYNYHLAEEINKDKKEKYIKKIEEKLQRKLEEDDKYHINIYGLEAFYIGSLKKLDEKHFFEGWKKMNKLWNISKQNSKEYLKENSVNYYLDLLIQAQKENLYFKIGTSIDHLIKIFEQKNKIDIRFDQIVEDIFPFLYCLLNT